MSEEKSEEGETVCLNGVLCCPHCGKDYSDDGNIYVAQVLERNPIAPGKSLYRCDGCYETLIFSCEIRAT